MNNKDILDIVQPDGPIMRCLQEPKIKEYRYSGKLICSDEQRNASWNAYQREKKLTQEKTK